MCVCCIADDGTVIGADEVPPPYENEDGSPMVTCRVCQTMIDITGKMEQHVVKCQKCNEATVSISTYSNYHTY